MERRDLFRILAAGAAAPLPGQHAHPDPSSGTDVPAEYRPRFFTAEEYEIINDLCAILIPADDHSAGAREAGEGFYADSLLHYAEAPVQRAWREGLRAVEDHAVATFGRPFVRCSPAERERVVAAMASHEGDPRTELERFFLPCKRLVVEGYLYSTAGRREGLGYRGDVALGEFPGCTHAGHAAE